MKFWNSIINIGIHNHDGAFITRQKKINNQFTLFTSVAISVFVPYMWLIENYFFVKIEIFATFLLFTTFLVNYAGLVKTSAFLRYIIVVSNVFYAAIEMPNAGFEYFLIPLSLVPFILLDKPFEQLSLLSFTLFAFFIRLHISENNHSPEIIISRKNSDITYMIVLSMVFILCALFVIRFKIAGKKFESVIQQQLSEIEEQKKDILDSIVYAKRIQTALITNDTLLNEHLSDYFILFKPKAIVAGDFYWASPTPEGFLYITADCTGHGVPGALMSVLNINKLNDTVLQKKIFRPDLILNEVRKEVIKVLNPEGSIEECKDGMDAILCQLDLVNMKLKFAAANNSFYIFRKKKLINCKADKMSIGKGHNDLQTFTYNEFSLHKGDVIYTLTDGYADQFGGPQGKKFKYKRLEDLLLSICELPLNEQKLVLNEQFEKWRGTLEQVDDVCIIGVRV